MYTVKTYYVSQLYYCTTLMLCFAVFNVDVVICCFASCVITRANISYFSIFVDEDEALIA